MGDDTCVNVRSGGGVYDWWLCPLNIVRGLGGRGKAPAPLRRLGAWPAGRSRRRRSGTALGQREEEGAKLVCHEQTGRRLAAASSWPKPACAAKQSVAAAFSEAKAAAAISAARRRAVFQD